jgi:hypothetical protein
MHPATTWAFHLEWLSARILDSSLPGSEHRPNGARRNRSRFQSAPPPLSTPGRKAEHMAPDRIDTVQLTLEQHDSGAVTRA